jgi:nicotinate-nucleotide adenylyltransferase
VRKQRIGIFGGTFDPPHIGHLVIAERARVQLQLVRVIFVPAYRPPHKTRRSSTTPLDRLALTRLAVHGNPSFVVSDIEIKRQGVSYTIDTVKEFLRRLQHAELFLILGSDNLAELTTWKSYNELLQLVQFVVYPRPGASLKRPPQLRGARIHVLQGMQLDISSSTLRNLVQQRSSIRYLVPLKVEKYIADHKLYRH